jgi:Short repeat of unknown function (DUF308)
MPHTQWIQPLAGPGPHHSLFGMSQSVPFIPDVPGPLQRLARDAWQAVLLIGLSAGLLGALAGLVVIAAPFSSIAILTVFAGIWLLVTGVAEIISALRIRGHVKRITAGVGDLISQAA